MHTRFQRNPTRASAVAWALPALFASVLPGPVDAQPTFTGMQVSTYATVTDPVQLAFGDAGELFAGRDNSGSGGGVGDAVAIHRIPPGGGAGVALGPPIDDPDAVVVDRDGVFGAPGGVLVGSSTPSSQGLITHVDQAGTATVLFGPTTSFLNPLDMVFDAGGRCLFTDFGVGAAPRGDVLSTSGGSPALLATLSGSARAGGIAVAGDGRIFVTGHDQVVRIFDANGASLNLAFATGAGVNSLAFGSGVLGFGTDLYAPTPDRTGIVRIDTTGALTQVGFGFEGIRSLRFGPDGALYVSEFELDRVVRIAPASTPVPTYAPGATRLLANTPNPFHPHTHIRYVLSRDDVVDVSVFDLHGRHMRTLDAGSRRAGEHRVRFDGRDDDGRRLDSGVYFYRLRTTVGEWTRRMAMLQ